MDPASNFGEVPPAHKAHESKSEHQRLEDFIGFCSRMASVTISIIIRMLSFSLDGHTSDRNHFDWHG